MQTPQKVTSGPYEVHLSGTYFSFMRNDLVVEVAPGFKLRFVLPGEGPTTIDATVGPPDTMVITVGGWDLDGHGWASPIKIGTVGGRAAHVSFRVTTYGLKDAGSYRIELTIFLGEVV